MALPPHKSMELGLEIGPNKMSGALLEKQPKYVRFDRLGAIWHSLRYDNDRYAIAKCYRHYPSRKVETSNDAILECKECIRIEQRERSK